MTRLRFITPCVIDSHTRGSVFRFTEFVNNDPEFLKTRLSLIPSLCYYYFLRNKITRFECARTLRIRYSRLPIHVVTEVWVNETRRGNTREMNTHN